MEIQISTSQKVLLVINSAKSNQICDSLHDVQVAASEEDFIVGALPEAIASYRNGVMTDAMFSSLTEATLNSFFIYSSGTFTITDPTPGYKNLTLATSGAKKLLGNVSVKGTYTLTGPATLNSNGFALTNP